MISRFRRIFNNHKTLIVSVFFLVMYATTITLAVPPSSPYTPGATLDPQCAPGSTFCTVSTGGSSQWDDVSGGINYAGGRVGIGSTTPRAALDIAGDGAIIATGTFGSGIAVPDLGAGTRMMWIPSAAAFRVGLVDGTQWDSANVGNNSAAFGYDTIASGYGSFAFGGGTTASGELSFAGGGGSVASGDQSFAIGASQATGYGAFAISGSTASGGNSFAGGASATASGDQSFAFSAATASGNNSFAFGSGASAEGSDSFALGSGAHAALYNDIAIGSGSSASGGGSFAFGGGANAEGSGSFAFGSGSHTTGSSSFAFGGGATASEYGAFAVGGSSTASGTNSVAFASATASGNGAFAVGGGSNASGFNAFAVGGGIIASGNYSFSGGGGSKALGDFSFGFGNNTVASDDNAIALGFRVTASGLSSTAFGTFSTASGATSTVFGNSNVASGDYSTAFGNNTLANSYNSFAIGSYNIGGGDTDDWVNTDSLFEIGNGDDDNNRSNALTVLKNGYLGLNTATPRAALDVSGDGAIIATGTFSSGIAVPDLGAGSRMMWIPSVGAFRAGILLDFGSGATQWDSANVGIASAAFGATTTASGAASAAFGSLTVASGTYAAAFGSNTTASGVLSTAFGSSTIASGQTSNAFGYATIASGGTSTAFGAATVASGAGSTAFGQNTVADSYNSFALGQYNIGGGDPDNWVSTESLFEIGNGTDSGNRANALTVLKNGYLGLNTATPRAALDVSGDGAIIATGTDGVGIAVPDLGAGTRLMWIPSKGAFRAGTVGADQWDSANVGVGSVVFGDDGSIASGYDSAAFGEANTASGLWSAVFGTGNIVSGDGSISSGQHNTVSGEFSAAFGNTNTVTGGNSVAFGNTGTSSGIGSATFGQSTTASAFYSTAFGLQTVADSYGAFALGQYNIVSGGNPNNWIATDTAFSIGNGTDSANLSNALTVLKNGNTTIAGALTLGTALSVTNGGTGGITAADARTNLGLVYATGTEVKKSTQVAFWGDSLTAGQGGTSFPSQFSTLSGYNAHNFGVGGETSTQIKGRFDANTVTRDYAQVIWSGRNDVTLGLTNTLIKSNIAAMISSLTHTNYLILGVIKRETETTGTPNSNAIDSLNADLATTYGPRFIDVQAYLLTQGNGSANDNTDIANGITPRSLRADDLHLNTLGYSKVAQLVYQSVSYLKGINDPNKIVTLDTLLNASASGKSQIGVSASGSFKIGGIDVAYLPNQDNFLGSVVFGDGGKGLTHTTGTEGYNNTIVGIQAAPTISTGWDNTTLGRYSLYGLTTGQSNVAVGNSALFTLTTGQRNTALGSYAMTGGSGSSNVAVGYTALQSITAGDENTAVGTGALSFAFGAGSSARSTVVGYRAGFGVTGANNNTFFGYRAGDNVTSGSNNLIIGYDADAASPTGSNQMTIGNIIYGTGITGTGATIAGNVGIGLNNPAYRFDVLSSATAQTATARVANFANTGATFNTTGGALSAYGGYFSSVATRASGANALTNIGLYATASGAQNNYGLIVGAGLVGIGTTTPGSLLTVGAAATPAGIIAHFETATGTCNLDPSNVGGLSCSSDMNLKKNITVLADNSLWSFNGNVTPANNAVFAKLLALTPVQYNFKAESDSDVKHTGFIAQEVEQLFPDLIETNTDGKKTMNYVGLVPYTIQAIQDMNFNITKLDDLDRPNTWRESLIAWFGSATNGIKSLVVQDKVCVDNECLTKDDIHQLLEMKNHQNGGGTGGGTVITTGGGDAPADSIEDGAEDEGTPPVEDSEEEVSDTPVEDAAAPVIDTPATPTTPVETLAAPEVPASQPETSAL